ncbi:hypothetical protein [Sphingobium cupriresistens]|uniref:hypothetical protein n=1 Tax=Sphingobium cupriresistens TaxID=1132417 RepID=UPI003BADDBDD
MSSHPFSEVSKADAADQIGTPAYRARHISMLWKEQLWHEAIMILGGGFAGGLLFYAIAKDLASWAL